MFEESFTIKVRDLMTTDIYYLPSEYTVEDAAEELQEKKFNVAPIETETSPYHYIRRDKLEELTRNGCSSDNLKKHASRIDLENIVSPDANFEELIDLLEEEMVYFIGWNDELEGIITRADLNKLPSHTYLYSMINQIETYLRDIIHETTPEVIDEKSEEARKKYKADGNADLQLRLIDYTTFGDLKNIANEYELVSQQLPFSQDNTVRILSDIKDLRNDVAHHGNIISIMQIDQSTNNRDVTDLRRIYKEMERLISAENPET
jgi:CBS domain-containing protein